MRIARTIVPMLFALGACLMLAAAPVGQYTVMRDAGVVIDNMTTLTWQRGGSDIGVSLGDAGVYCKELTLGGFVGWRVPTKFELETLVSRDRTNPAIDINAFPDTLSRSYWTSTPMADSPSEHAWVVAFEEGFTVSSLLSAQQLVRCVR
jgi:hypothetical protein